MPATKNLHATPESVEHAFYDALEHADLEALMEVWSEDDDIVHVLPNGPRLVGHADIRAAWREIFANGPVHARPVQRQTIQQALVAVHSLTVQLIISDAEQTAIVNLHASNVYFKGANGWRLVLHHASQAPEGAVSAVAPPPGVLH